MSEHFFQIELLHGSVAVFDHPVIGVPAWVFGGIGAVAVTAGVEGQGWVEGWKGIDWVRGKGECRWCAMYDLEDDG